MSYIDANQNQVQSYTQGVPPIVSLTNATAISNGLVLDGLTTRANASMSVTLSATATAGTVTLQPSLDGVNFFNTGTAISPTAAGTTATTSVNVLARYIRAAITTAIVGTGANVTVSVGLNG